MKGVWEGGAHLHFMLCDASVISGVQVDGVIVEVALQWCTDTFSDLLVGFVNSVKTIDGGTHIEGFKVCEPKTLLSHAEGHHQEVLNICPTLTWQTGRIGLVGMHWPLTL